MAKPKPSTPLVEAWRTSHAVNLYLLEKLDAKGLRSAYAERTRDVAAQLAHVHAVRLLWLQACAPQLAEGMAKLPKEPRPTKAQLKKALKQSADAMVAFLEQCEGKGKVPGWDGSVASFVGYLTAHEAHHRALAIVALRVAGAKLPSEVLHGMWEWHALGSGGAKEAQSP